MLNIDHVIINFDKGLRTLFTKAQTARPLPGADLPEPDLTSTEKRLAGALMRINHSGEICAQALYQGQALTARDPQTQKALKQAAAEETEHLAWCESRIQALGTHKSFLNPLWYTGSLAIGALAGAIGDKWSLGFLAETEHQVGAHLEGHLQRLPAHDEKSHAVLVQMREDEAKHATTALQHGGVELPVPVKQAMKLNSKVMTTVAYWV
ncbi:2-polyprenyl-3-methyl-6-methoxy-1,4-benzoquinone monooxygenase [Sulfurirhabdus autotrophica]|uniref:3-demethoxyubiquinol 3-hydroxylase n=1 Tax=Sulfurirhabdus autotrophica TaxID=1706046 RepID=A0A4R3XZ98_9PROT|nr:2-polyprenyl-3-methyl-6-methoxy-1,4-benzoquinone monooxygenase [Sulfurirhabdus autotrophica]TCV84670.1 ubiquinone biosynthesis monooxygenase Coq7 [Sulfurirhabdus autotrophica]